MHCMRNTADYTVALQILDAQLCPEAALMPRRHIHSIEMLRCEWDWIWSEIQGQL
jgi:hypothetical protein